MDAAQLIVRVSASGVEKTAAELGALDKAGAQAAASTRKVGGAAKDAMPGMAGLMGTAKSLGAAVGLAGVAGGVIAATKTVVGFDQSMRNVNSIAGLSERKFQKLSASVNNLAGPTAQAPQTLADGLYQIVSSGFKAGDGLKILKASAVAATAGLTDTETATTAVVGALNAYHLKARDAKAVSDDLFQTVNLGVLSFKDLAQGIGPVLPFASKLGINLKQVGAMTATLTKAGVPAAEAFTYQKGAMVGLIKPTDQLAAVYKKLGVASGAELVHKTGSFQAALESLYKAVGSNTQAFAKLFPDIRGMTAAFAVTGKGAAGAKADLLAFANTSGATNKVFKEQSKSAAVQWRRMISDLQSGAIDLGRKVLPEVVKAERGVAKFVEQMRTGKGDGGQFAKTMDQIGSAFSNVEVKSGVLKGAFNGLLNGSANLAQNVGTEMGSSLRKFVAGDGLATNRLIKTKLVVQQDASVQAAAGILSQLQHTKLGKKVMQVLAADGDARGKLGWLIALGIPPKTAKILADVASARGGIQSVHDMLAALTDKTISVKVIKSVTQIDSAFGGRSKGAGHASGRGPGASERALVGEGGGPEWVGSSPDNMRLVSGPTLMDLGPGDYVIPTESRYASRAAGLWGAMGVATYAHGKAPSQMMTAYNPVTGKRERHTAKWWADFRKNHKAAYARQRDRQQNPLSVLAIGKADAGVAAADVAAGPNADGLTPGQTKALGADKRAIQRRLAIINRKLAKGGLTRGQRGALLSEKTSLLGQLGGVDSRLAADPLAAGEATYSQGLATGDVGMQSAGLNTELGIATGFFNKAVASGDTAGIIKWGQKVKELRDSIDGLTTATQDQTAVLQQQMQLQQEINTQLATALSSSHAELRAIGQYITGVVSGQVGQRVGRTQSVPKPMRLAAY